MYLMESTSGFADKSKNMRHPPFKRQMLSQSRPARIARLITG